MENHQELVPNEEDRSAYFKWPLYWIMHIAMKKDSKSPPPENLMTLNVSNMDINISGIIDDIRKESRDREQPSEQCTDLLDLFVTYYLPTVILVGLIGNILSCIVFLNTHLKMRSSSYYLAALSTADFGFLLSISFVWLNNTFGIKVYNTNGWCQGLVYLSSVCSFLSVWLIVSFTVERFIAVQYPLHRPRMCTVHRAKTVISVLTGIAIFSHTYSFFTVGMKLDEHGEEVCELRDGYDGAMRVISIIDSIVTLIVPLVMIIVMNTMIMKNLLKFSESLERSCSFTRNERRNQFQLQWLTKTSTATGTSDSPAGSPSEETTPADSRTDSTIRIRMSSVRNSVTTRTQRNITKMLLLISTVFVLLNLPSYIMRLYSLWHQRTPTSLWCMQQVSVLLYYTNFSINFLLYSMYGITFRKCLWQLVQNKFNALIETICTDPY